MQQSNGTATPANGSAANASAGADGGVEGAIADLADQFRALVEELTTTQGRLAVSVAVLLFTAIVAIVVLPYAVRAFRRVVDSRLLSGRFGAVADVLSEYMPTSATEVLLRSVQVALLLVAAMALLVVWGLIGLAATVWYTALGFLPDLVAVSITLLIVALAFVASDQLQRGVDRLSEQADRITDHQGEIAVRVGQVTIAVTAVASILTLWGWELTGLLVGAGFLGIVVGFAARQTLGSLIAGFVLMFSRPFTIGDWVEIGEAEGIVTNITIFNTRLENFDGEVLVIPNDLVGNHTVVNRSERGLLRLTQDVGIDYEDDPEEAIEVAVDAMDDVEEVAETPKPQVIPKGFADSSILLELRFWIDHPSPPRKWQAVSAVVRGVKSAFDDEGITIPFPQRTYSNRPEDTADTQRTVEPEAGGGPDGSSGDSADGTSRDGASGNGASGGGPSDGATSSNSTSGDGALDGGE